MKSTLRTAAALLAVPALAGCGGGVEDASIDAVSDGTYSTYQFSTPQEAKWGAAGTVIAFDAEAGSITLRITDTLTVDGGEIAGKEASGTETYALDLAALRCDTTYTGGWAIPIGEVVPGGAATVWGSGSAAEGVVTGAFFDNQKYCDTKGE